jgi:hypothetical protein
LGFHGWNLRPVVDDCLGVHCDTDPHHYCHTCPTHAYIYSDQHTYTYTYANADADADAYANTYGYCYTAADRYANADANSDRVLRVCQRHNVGHNNDK